MCVADGPSMRSQCPVRTQISTSMTEREKESSSARVKRPQQPKEILQTGAAETSQPDTFTNIWTIRGGEAWAALSASVDKVLSKTVVKSVREWSQSGERPSQIIIRICLI